MVQRLAAAADTGTEPEQDPMIGTEAAAAPFNAQTPAVQPNATTDATSPTRNEAAAAPFNAQTPAVQPNATTDATIARPAVIDLPAAAPLAAPVTHACSGHTPELPGNFFDYYPFARHNPEHYHSGKFDWRVGYGVLYALECTDVEERGDTCPNCKDFFAGDQGFKATMRTIFEVEDNDGDDYDPIQLDSSQIHHKAKKYRQERDDLQLRGLNDSRKIASLTKAVTLHKKLIVILGGKNVVRLQQVIGFCIRQGRSISHMVDQVKAAANGIHVSCETAHS